jgi:hypothetical protein
MAENPGLIEPSFVQARRWRNDSQETARRV